MATDNNNSEQVYQQLISGIIFLYDDRRNAFVEKDNPKNHIPMDAVWENTIWTQFFFDKGTWNIYTGGFPNGERPEGVSLVIIPSLPYCTRLGISVKPHLDKAKKPKLKHLQADAKRYKKRKQAKRI